MGLDMDSSDCADDLDILCFLCLSFFLFRTALFHYLLVELVNVKEQDLKK